MSEHELWNELGNLYFLSGAYESAIHAYTKAIEINHQFGRPYSNIALIYAQKGQYDRAIRSVQRSLELLTDPHEKAISWNRLGNIYRQCKDYNLAIAAYQKADEADSQSRDGQNQPEREVDALLTITVAPLDLSAASREEGLLEDLPAENASPSMTVAPLDLSVASREEGLLEDLPAENASPSMTVAPLDLSAASREEGLLEDLPAEDASSSMTVAPLDLPAASREEGLLEDLPAEDASPSMTVAPLDLPAARSGEGILEDLPAEDASSSMAVTAPAPEGRANLVEISEPVQIPDETIPLPPESIHILEQEAGHPDRPALGEDNLADAHNNTALSKDSPTDPTEKDNSRTLPDTLQKAVEKTMLTLLLSAPPPQVKEEDKAKSAGHINHNEEGAQPLMEEEASICVTSDLEKLMLNDEIRKDDLHAVRLPVRKDISQNPAVKDLKAVLEINPQDALAWDALGNIYKANGLYQEAISAYEQSLLLDPESPSFNYHLGLVYAATGRHEEALGLFKKVIRLEPQNGLAHATLSGCYRRLGLNELARYHIEKAIFLNNTFRDESEYNRACLESICGNTDRALEFLEQALQSSQSYAEWALHDPDLDFIRTDPRFAALIARYQPAVNLNYQDWFSKAENAITA